MIVTKHGDVFSVERGMIVHGCNCQGVMGSGVALTVRERYPNVYAAYKEQEKAIGLSLGNISYAQIESDEYYKYVVNAVTQNLSWRENNYSGGRLTSYDAVTECFHRVVNLAKKLGVTEIAFPKIGAVRGAGSWSVISAIIDDVVPDSFSKTLYLFDGP